ncbi:MAG TPA: homoserine dehydrogenase [Vicinamibacterales bacterium]|nr:homoserine dehydrogenase [Vicinamibacterales bacterium]
MKPRCRIALVGFGHVGSAVAYRLATRDRIHGLELTHIVDRRAAQKRHAHGELPVAWSDAFDDALHSDVDVIVETIGGLEPAAAWIESALRAGKSVVTANKQVIARHGLSLQRLAARQGRQLRFEAAVGGAMPIVRAIGEGLSGDRITSITAILNGTTNAVLSTIEATGCTLDAALADARLRGFAEADPSADLDGDDAAAKLAILCGLAFHVVVDPRDIERQSCAAIGASDFEQAAREGHTIRQIAAASFDYRSQVLTAAVTPKAVPRASIFGRTSGPANAALIVGEHSGETGIFGIGAGGDATAVAIISDLVAIARDRAAVIPAPQWRTCDRIAVSSL